jgi:hypothetical protein
MDGSDKHFGIVVTDHLVPFILLVKTGQHVGDTVEHTPDRLAWLLMCHYRRQSVLIAISAHDDDRFGRRTGRVGEGCDSKLTIGRQPTVELEFPQACALALLGCAEIKKVGQQRLFRLEWSVANQNDYTRVCFAHINVGNRRRRQ